jgi:hypothetical protein
MAFHMWSYKVISFPNMEGEGSLLRIANEDPWFSSGNLCCIGNSYDYVFAWLDGRLPWCAAVMALK